MHADDFLKNAQFVFQQIILVDILHARVYNILEKYVYIYHAIISNNQVFPFVNTKSCYRQNEIKKIIIHISIFSNIA